MPRKHDFAFITEHKEVTPLKCLNIEEKFKYCRNLDTAFCSQIIIKYHHCKKIKSLARRAF